MEQIINNTVYETITMSSAKKMSKYPSIADRWWPREDRLAKEYMPTVIIYIMGITGAELLTSLDNPVAGIICHAVILFSLLINSSLAVKESCRRLYVALALAPMIRIMSLAMPLEDFTNTFKYLIIAIPLFAAVLVAIRILNLTPSTIGLRKGNLIIQGIVASTGLIFGYMEYIILEPESLISDLTWQQALPPALILLALVGLVEELVFRGVLQTCARDVLGSRGWIYVAFVFAILHIGYLSIAHFGFILLVGFFFGWAVEKTGSILGVTLSHGIANILLFLVLPHVI